MAMAVKQRAATTFSTLAPSPHAEENMPWSVTPSTLVVPSMWSAEAFFRAGVPRERVAVAAHGVDTNLFRPARDASEKLKARVKLIGAEYFAPVHEAGDPSEARYETIETKRGNKKRRRKEKKHGSKKIWQERVVFLHVGAMTPNKGVPALLDAFSSVVASWTPSSVMAPPLLVLKGLDELYSSSAALDVVRDLLQSLLRRNFAAYIGGVLSRKTVGELFRAADVYVTASRSEGFGLPIAEAAASGLAVIAPAGGAVEEITDPSFTKYVESQIKEQPQESHDDGMSVMTNNGDCVTIKASMSHLVSTLEHVTKDQKFRQKASVFARNYALRYLSLEHSTDVLLGVLQDDQWASG
jgi:glycosyltransferase involved in cell wall biosynthesis